MGTLAATAVGSGGSVNVNVNVNSSVPPLPVTSSTSSSSIIPGILARLDLDVALVDVGVAAPEEIEGGGGIVKKESSGGLKRVRSLLDRIVGGATSSGKDLGDYVDVDFTVSGKKKPRFTIFEEEEGEGKIERSTSRPRKRMVLPKEDRIFGSNLSLKATTVPQPRMAAHGQQMSNGNGVCGSNGGVWRYGPKQRKPLPALSPINNYVSDGGGNGTSKGNAKINCNRVVPTSSGVMFPSILDIASLFGGTPGFGMPQVCGGVGLATATTVPVQQRKKKIIQPSPRRRSAPPDCLDLTPSVTVSAGTSTIQPQRPATATGIPRNKPVNIGVNKNGGESLGRGKDKDERVVLVEGMMQPGKKNHNKIKRPLNAFMVWSKLQRRKIMDNDPTVHHSLISKQLGAGWKSLSEEERRPYYEEAQKLGKLHNHMYPDYKYRPRRKQNSSAISALLGSSPSSSYTSSSTTQQSSSFSITTKPFITVSKDEIFSHDGSLDLSMKSGQSHSDYGSLDITPVDHEDYEEDEDEELPLDMSCSSAKSSGSSESPKGSTRSWNATHDGSGDEDMDEDRLFIDES